MVIKNAEQTFQKQNVAVEIISKEVVFYNGRGKKIVGFYDCSPNSKNSTVIIIPSAHGETKKNNLFLSYFLATNGFDVIRYDHTNHVGESDGDIFDVTLDSMKDDLESVIKFTNDKYKNFKIGIIAPSLTARVAMRVVAENDRIDFLICLFGVVNIRSTLEAVYGEDVIGNIFLGNYKNNATFNIMGFESSFAYPNSAIKGDYYSLESTHRDVVRIKCPMFFFSGTKDVWVRIEEVKSLINIESKNNKELFVVNNAMHILYENPSIAKEVVKKITSVCLRCFLDVSVGLEHIKSPNMKQLIRQSSLERMRLRNCSRLDEDEEKFWNKYINKYVVIERSYDYQEYLSNITDYLGGINSGETILDVGCGPGHYCVWLLKKLSDRHTFSVPITYAGVDFAETALMQAKQNYLEIKSYLLKKGLDINNLMKCYFVSKDLDRTSILLPYVGSFGKNSFEFKEKSIDKICCSLLISYLKNPIALLKDLNFLLKDGGKIIVTSLKPYADLSIAYKNLINKSRNHSEVEEARLLLNSVGSIRYKEAVGHYKFFNEEEIADLFCKAGFKEVKTMRLFTDQVNVCLGTK